MPSVKIPKKSTWVDMTPFVDVAFLILTFFIMATEFKPPAAVTVTTPRSVSSDKLKEEDAVLIEFDSSGRVFFTMNIKKEEDKALKRDLINEVNKNRNLGLTDVEMQNFVQNSTVGTPFAGVKSLLQMSKDQRRQAKQSGIRVDSTDNELVTWIASAKVAFQGRSILYMIKGDNNATYPTFKGVIEAFRKNDQFKYQLITDPKSAPPGTELYAKRAAGVDEGDE